LGENERVLVGKFEKLESKAKGNLKRHDETRVLAIHVKEIWIDD
jgi:hypothetical protein